MPKNDVYMYYSGATDVTGKKLCEALDITGGNKKPAAAKKVVISWGCKTKDPVALGADVKVLNHPDKVRDNRNKFKTLKALRAAGNKVANFVDADNVMAKLPAGNDFKLPLVGRKNFHQGGKGFWLCLTKAQVGRAIDEGAQYFQEYMDIADEYRLHVFRGKIINAQKKVRRNNMEEAFVAQHGEKIRNFAAKKEVALDEATVDYVLGRMAKGHPNPDMIVRSNTRGWKFSQQKLANVPKALADEAISSLKAVDLDFGAVDCCTLQDGTVAIIEINSGPGLQGTSFTAYEKAFKKYIEDVKKPKPAKAAAAPKEAAAKKIGAKPAGKKVAEAAADVAGGAKAQLKAKMAMVEEMLDVADDNEAEVLNNLFSKMAAE